MQVDVRALKQALWRSLQEVRAQSADDTELDFQVCIPFILHPHFLGCNRSEWHRSGQIALTPNFPCLNEAPCSSRHRAWLLGAIVSRRVFIRIWMLQEVMGRALCGASPELLRDLSVHVCFICLLHLANENSLRISGVPSLDRLTAGNVTLTAS